MNRDLQKKISIGLSLSISYEEYKKIIDKYNSYLSSIYFSLPLGDEFHTRSLICTQFNSEENIEKFYRVITLFHDNGIKLDCVFNKNELKEDEVKKGINFLKNNIPVDQITCLNEHVSMIDELYPDCEKIYSFNNNLDINKIDEVSKKFSKLVVGKDFLRNQSKLQTIEQENFKIKLLVNNGCSFICNGCISGTRNCQRTFNKNLLKHDINYLYALQSFYPFELKELFRTYNGDIAEIKISNRTSGYNYLDNCLYSYINYSDTDDFIKEDFRNYRLWCRLGWFGEYLKSLDSDIILSEKQKILTLGNNVS